MYERSFFTEANRKAWNCAMPYHRRAMDKKWDEILADKDHIIQQEPELTALKRIGIEGKSVVHLCCNNGLELMSLKRLGAGRCVGFDICDEAIEDARKRAEMFSIEVEFQIQSVYDISEEFFHCFDLVYITIGALTWMPDLQEFFGVVRKLLRTGGELFIYEQHPFSEILPWDVAGEGVKPQIENSYFHDDYFMSREGLDYYGNESYEAPETYEFAHTLSDIISAIIENGFCITLFNEYEDDISNGFGWVKRSGLRLPLSYILTAKC